MRETAGSAAAAAANCRQCLREDFMASLSQLWLGHSIMLVSRSPARVHRLGDFTYSCCPARRRRHKALGRYLMRCERIGVDRGSKSRRQYKLSGYEPQRLGEQAYIRLQKSIELAGVANGGARDTGFHPTPNLRRQTIAEHRFHSP